MPLPITSVRYRGYLLAFLIVPCLGMTAEPEIHRCTQADGTVAFQEMPCPEPATEDDRNDAVSSDDAPALEDPFDFVNPFDEVAEPTAAPVGAPETPVSEDREACIKETRDAIDAIDLELQTDSSKDQREIYLAELLELTRQLRACKGG